MKLSSYSDYSLRTLLYLGTCNRQALSSIDEIATIYKISKNHISKIVFDLGKMGLIDTIRGRNGGIRLAISPKEINIGSLIRKTEKLEVVECFSKHSEQCVINKVCKLKAALNEAVEAYLRVLDHYTLQDVIQNQDELQQIFLNEGKF